MQKDIKYGGYTASPSDYECADGDLAAAYGMLPEDGSLKPILPPGNKLIVNQGLPTSTSSKTIHFVHKTSSYVHYIATGTNNSTSNTLCWISESGTATFITDMVVSNLHDINAVGNTLIVADDNGMHYLLWKSDTSSYKYLGTHLPELPISFGLQCEVRKSDTFDINFNELTYWVIDMEERQIRQGTIWDELDEENKSKVTPQVLSKVNKFITEESTKAGRFLFPFFVRYAYRLYDGSLTMHSAPVLMITTSDLAPQVLWERLTGSGNTFTKAEANVVGALHKLDYAVLEQAYITQLSEWSDIVSSVDFFVSKPIYTYDQNGMVTRFSQTDDYEGYSICKHTNQNAGYNTDDFPQRYQRYEFKTLYAWTFGTSGAYPMGRVILPEKSPEAIAEEIKGCQLFYFLKSLHISELSTSRTTLDIDEDYLTSLVAREVMTDDYDSHTKLYPKFLHNYNSRLNAANIEKKLFQGFHPGSLFCHTDGYIIHDVDISNTKTYDYTNMTNNFTISVYLKKNGKEIVVGDVSDIGVYHYGCREVFFYYPDTDAFKARIKMRNQWSTYASEFYYDVPLTPHTGLNGSYCFIGWEGLPEMYRVTPNPSGHAISPVADWVIGLANKIYTSEVNNPFLFPLAGINTVGVGEIMGICAAVKALSEGQFGYFPLYAFTTEGVWSMKVKDDGWFQAVQPVTQDVCINSKSITQLDTAVLFATDRGIMLLSGSNTVCITDSLVNDGQLLVSTLPHFSDLSTVDANSVAYADFKDYIADCRIVYDYIHQRLIVFNTTYPDYSYVYSLKSKTWGMLGNISGERESWIVGKVQSYPEALAVIFSSETHGDFVRLVDFCEEGTTTTGLKGLLVTRPIKLDMPDILKTIDTVIQRGKFERGHVKTALYGSRNLITWHLVWTSTDQYLRGFRGTPYKYFRIMAICTLDEGESLYGASFQFTPRLTDNMR